MEDGEASETQDNQEKEVAEDDQGSEAVTTLSEDEIMTEVVDHLNQELLEEGSGTYSIFRAETQQTDTDNMFSCSDMRCRMKKRRPSLREAEVRRRIRWQEQ